MEEVTIYQLQDNNGNNIAGLTPEQAVYDQDGVRLPDKLDQLKNNSGVGKAYVDSEESDGTGEIFNSYSGMLGENTAEGQYSHAEGNFNSAGGKCSHTEGYYNSASNDYQHVEGIYSFSRKGTTESDTPIHVIGIGTGERMQLNAVEIMRNGDNYIYGIGNYDGTNYSSAQTLQEVVNNKADSIGIVTGSTGEVTQEISPNKFYKFGECSTLTITLGAELSDVYNEYMFQFSSGDTPTVLTLPETVKWIGDSLVDSNKTYQVSIVNNIAVMGGA